MEYKRYWGDLHTHCAISYGYGSLERAMLLGRDHLDFCSVVGHATWHDMPTDRERHGFVIDFHKEGFERLAQNWKAMQETVARHNDPGHFVTFLSYEWHSCAYGDHNVYYLEDDGEIVERDSLDELEAALKGKEVMMHPHHIGYGAGYRGVNWEHFESRRSPAIEIFSGHGGSERDGGPYPMYHTMGPRQHTGTVAHGLALGKRFGFLAGTDHHAGYPGHYGEGRTAVYAPDLTRRGIWDAIRERRCYAVTGDRIGLSFGINDAMMGGEVDASGTRTVTVEVAGCDVLDRVEVVKNNRPLKRVFGPGPPRELRDPVTAKIRVEWGWGDKDAPIRWDADIRLAEGELLSVEPCFTGDAILAPGADKGGVADSDEIPHKITAQDVRGVSWYSHTSGNPHPYLRSTNALILEVRGPRSARLQLNANGYHAAYTLSDLLEGSRCEFIRGWRSEAILTHRAIPEQMLQTSLAFEDGPENETDIYYARVSQENNQWAWASPIWAQA